MTRSTWTATTKVESAPYKSAAVDISAIPPGAKAKAAVVNERLVSFETKYEHNIIAEMNTIVVMVERMITFFYAN